MTIDELLAGMGIDATTMGDILDDVAANIDPALLAAANTRYYTVTPSATDGEYTAIDLSTLGVTRILNGISTKSGAADIVVSSTVQPTETTPDEAPDFYFAWHGGYMLIENGDAPVIIKAHTSQRLGSAITGEMALELKSLWLYLKSRDTDGVFACMSRISRIAGNARAELKDIRPVVKRQKMEIAPWQL